MPLSIGVNLRVTGHCNQGGRKYMEDMFSVAYQQTPDEKDLEYAFFGIFDGHGGGEAATFAKEHLMDIIVKQKNFWSDRDEDVLRAIRDGYVNTHYAMWRELDKWPRTASGLPSTAGTTASIAFIRKGKMYIGHVGDSGIILGHQVEGDPQWRAKALTKDHKPESTPEMIRIQESGGKVVSKSGVPRVVWNRPRIGHKGPVRRSTHIDEIPFLAVARSLGDLWSYNSELNTFVVSPEPDVKVVAIDVKSHRCLIFGTDGLWNMLPPQAAVAIVQAADRHNEKHLIASQQTGSGQADAQMWINPSKSLVDRALERWLSTRLRADNTSVVTVMLDPPGPSRSEVLLSQKKERVLAPKNVLHHGVHGSLPSSLAENLQKHVYSIDTRNVPKPYPLNSNIDIVDPKQPDSSDEIDENLDDIIKSTNISSLDTAISTKMDMHRNTSETKLMETVEETSVRESIQVAEISSTDILEDIETHEMKKTAVISTEKLKLLDGGIDQTRTVKNSKIDGANVDTIVPQISNSAEPQSSIANVKTSASNVCNVIQPNPYTKTYEDLKPSVHLANRLNRDSDVVPGSTAFSDVELRNNIMNGTRCKQHTLFTNSREDIRLTKRKHSLSTQNNTFTDSDPCNSTSYMTVNSRYKSRNTKGPMMNSVNTAEEPMKNTSNRTSVGGGAVATKRRHSAIHQPVANSVGATMGVEDGCILQEPCFKRRTRSEDRPSPTDENDPANQTVADINSRLSWPANDTSASKSTSGATSVSTQDRLSSTNTFQRRSLGKKATPIKTIRRPSINSTNRLQLRGTFGLRDWDQTRNNRPSSTCNERRVGRPVSIIGSTEASTVPQRWLRSDTLAATPVRTLRSRNIDITGHTISTQSAHQYGAVKQNRLSLPNKLKPSTSNGALQTNRVRSSSMSSNKLKQTGNNGSTVGSCSSINATNAGSNSGSGMAKRVKSPYNPSARSLSTRSRIKRLGK